MVTTQLLPRASTASGTTLMTAVSALLARTESAALPPTSSSTGEDLTMFLNQASLASALHFHKMKLLVQPPKVNRAVHSRDRKRERKKNKLMIMHIFMN